MRICPRCGTKFVGLCPKCYDMQFPEPKPEKETPAPPSS